MDIIYKGKKTSSFGIIAAGEVFKYGEGIYMRIETVTSVMGIYFNATNLNSGVLASFDDNDTIELVDAQLVIS